ncbi:UNVERIFIED_CONTAM: hypothetical protein FKN15_019761 [Acipenser sinensis]
MSRARERQQAPAPSPGSQKVSALSRAPANGAHPGQRAALVRLWRGCANAAKRVSMCKSATNSVCSYSSLRTCLQSGLKMEDGLAWSNIGLTPVTPHPVENHRCHRSPLAVRDLQGTLPKARHGCHDTADSLLITWTLCPPLPSPVGQSNHAGSKHLVLQSLGGLRGCFERLEPHVIAHQLRPNGMQRGKPVPDRSDTSGTGVAPTM